MRRHSWRACRTSRGSRSGWRAHCSGQPVLSLHADTWPGCPRSVGGECWSESAGCPWLVSTSGSPGGSGWSATTIARPPDDDRDLRRRRGRIGAWRGGHRSGVRPAGAEGAGAGGGRPVRSRCRDAVLGGPDAPDVPRPRPDRRPRATLGRLRRGPVRRRGQRGQRGALPPARCLRPRGVDVALRHRGPDTRGPRAVASRGGGAVAGRVANLARCRRPPRCCVAAQNGWAGQASRCRAGPTSTRAAGRPCTRCSAPTSTTPRGRGARSGHARACGGSRSLEAPYGGSCASPVRRSAPTRSS